MNNISIKTYKLDEFPENSKIINQGNEIKRFFFSFYDWNGVFVTFLHQIQQLYDSADKKVTLYWKDEDDELIRIENDDQLKTAILTNNFPIKIYLIESDNYNNGTMASSLPNIVDKNKQKHLNIICDGCKNQIFGVRFVCNLCPDYDLCEKCHSQGIHKEHTFSPCPSNFGYMPCAECFKEGTISYNICKDCTIEKVPKLNEALKHKRLTWYFYEICDDCKLNKHADHSTINVSVQDLNKSCQRLVNEIEQKRKTGEERRTYSGISCYGCQGNTVGYKSTTYKNEYIICEDCLIEGCFTNYYSFSKLTDDDVQLVRSNAAALHQMKMKNLEISMNNIHSTSRVHQFQYLSQLRHSADLQRIVARLEL